MNEQKPAKTFVYYYTFALQALAFLCLTGLLVSFAGSPAGVPLTLAPLFFIVIGVPVVGLFSYIAVIAFTRFHCFALDTDRRYQEMRNS